MLAKLTGFRQSLLLLVVITTLGFSMLISTALLAFRGQAEASEKVALINHQLLELAAIHSGVVSVPTDNSRRVDVNEIRASEIQLLQHLQQDGAHLASNITDSFMNWTEQLAQTQVWWQTIGTDAKSGLRADVEETMAMIKSSIFSHMRTQYDDLVLAVDEMLELRTVESVAGVNKRLEEFRTLIHYLGINDEFDELLDDNEAAMEQLQDAILEYAGARDQASAALVAMHELMDQQEAILERDLQEANQNSEARVAETRITILATGIVVALVSGLLLLLIWRKATSTLGRTLRILELIAAGDLTQRMPESPTRNDDFDRLGRAVNELTQRLGGVLGEVKRSSQTLQQYSAELDQTLNKQTSTSEATEVETRQVADAIQQVSETVAGMAQALEETNRLSTQAQTATDKGGRVINTALGSLEHLSSMFDELQQQLDNLNTSSSRVDGVTAMIGGLAEQTNLLALNAAIESARAGEAGRGFSVVADEVRALAEKTVKATANINLIIQDMQGQLKQLLGTMSQGQNQVNSSRQMGDEAIQEMQQISSLFAQVSERNRQQASSVDTIARTTRENVSGLTRVVAQVADGTGGLRNIRQFSGNVVQHAGRLLDQTGQFRCDS
jgi:methyl-accepting chemotaxis protein